MTKEDEVMAVMETLVIAKDKHIGEVMAARGHWTAGQSARVNAGKVLKKLAESGRIERFNGCFRKIGCRSQFKEHSQLLTDALTELLKNYKAKVAREVWVEKIGLRADAICLLTEGNRGYAFILEILNNESLGQANRNKRRVWEQFPDANSFLSQLLGYKIPWFDFITLEPGESIIAKIRGEE